MGTRRLWIAGAAAAVAAGVAVPLVVLRSGGSTPAATTTAAPVTSYFGDRLNPPLHLADFALRDQNGQAVSLSSERGRPVLLTFLYTHCQDVCPLIATHIDTALRSLGSERKDVRAIAISVDPVGDTPTAVRSFVSQHRLVPEFRYLTGTQQELEPVWKAYHVRSQVDAKAGGHTAYTMLVDKRGRGIVAYGSNAVPRQFEHDLRIALASHS